MSWQPIETAPKDGTYVILVDCDLVTIGKWMNSDALRDEAWVGFDSIQSLHKTCVMAPTHWMPLPSPPGTEEEGGISDPR